MITKDLQAVTVDGVLEGEVLDMGIAADAVGHVMYQMANLYTDQVLAVIREISTNGFDATIDATDENTPERAAIIDGSAGRAIEVTLPSKLAPIFMVRDYGTGMSYEAIRDVYSKFGASTKRHSNDFNGALGFGCKAPLAYTPSFTVTSVSNGLRTTIAIGRKPDGGGAFTFPEKNEPTTERDGTMVMVPVKADDVVAFNTTAAEFFMDWKRGTVLVNGSEPIHRQPKFRLTDRLAVIEGDIDYVLMANVKYPVHSRLPHGLRRGYALLAEVDTGSVVFAPSREGLKANNNVNTAELARIVADFLQAAKGAIQRKIDLAKDKPEAMATMIYWRDVMPAVAAAPDGKYTFQGITLPDGWREQRLPGAPWPVLEAKIRSHIESRHYTKEYIEAESFGSDIFVTGFAAGKFTANHKRRLNLWREATDGTSDGSFYQTWTWNKTTGAVNYILLHADQVPADVAPWIESDRVVSWEHVRQNYKLPTSGGGFSGSRKALMGSYDDVYIEGTDGNGLPLPDVAVNVGETLAKDIRQNVPLYYFQTNSYYGSQAIDLLGTMHKQWTVVKLQSNRVNKFKRDFPQAREITTAAADAYKLWRAKVTEDQLVARAAHEALRFSGSGILSYLDPAKVNDPEVKRAIQLIKMDLTKLNERGRLFRQILGAGHSLPERKWKSPMDSYPLVAALRHAGRDKKTMDHTYLYLNAVHAATT